MKNVLLLLLGGFFILAILAARPGELTRAHLGAMLFHDNILSEDYSLSCASCHKPEFAFADTSAVSKGVRGKFGTRNTPSVMNMLNRDKFFWDGRAASLEEQALMPIKNPDEMNLPISRAVQRLKNHHKYNQLFKEVFGEAPNATNLGLAIAAFEQTLESGNAAHDKWMNDEPHTMSESAIRGRALFRDKAKCFDCHFSPDFTGDEFRNIGLFSPANNRDSGRFITSRIAADIGKFKTPGLRNVAITSPYMHDGRFKTLREVLLFYNNPSEHIKGAIGTDSLLLQPLGLTSSELDDLEAFLHSLTDPKFLK